jgi:hypothetical protein
MYFDSVIQETRPKVLSRDNHRLKKATIEKEREKRSFDCPPVKRYFLNINTLAFVIIYTKRVSALNYK